MRELLGFHELRVSNDSRDDAAGAAWLRCQLCLQWNDPYTDYWSWYGCRPGSLEIVANRDFDGWAGRPKRRRQAGFPAAAGLAFGRSTRLKFGSFPGSEG
jgi:hypothetical protein